MGRFVVGWCCVAIFLFRTASAQNSPDFSGTWKMDPSRSESAHQDAPIGPVLLIIKQTQGTFVLETRRSESNSFAVSAETLTCNLDGKEVKNAGSGVTVSAKAHWDGGKLIVETEREINGSTVTTMQTFQLDMAGKEITIDKTLTVQHGYQGTGAQKATGSGKDVFVRVESSR